MTKFSCFSALLVKKRKSNKEPLDTTKGHETLQQKLQNMSSSKEGGTDGSSFKVSIPVEIKENPTWKIKVLSKEEDIAGLEAVEAAYEGEGESENEKRDCSSMRRNFYDFGLRLEGEVTSVYTEEKIRTDRGEVTSVYTEEKIRTDRGEVGIGIIQGGSVSDPGISKTAFWGLPKLKRSCSSVETGDILSKIAAQLPSNSYENLENLARGVAVEGIYSKPFSVMTWGSADQVVLKKQSSSQVLPSRSHQLWWKLFLWNHRNLHRPATNTFRQFLATKSLEQGDGHCSDTLEASLVLAGGLQRTPEICSLEFLETKTCDKLKNKNLDCCKRNGGTRNQWVPFSSESSSLARVDEWVNRLSTESVLPVNERGCIEEGEAGENMFYHPSLEKSMLASTSSNSNLLEDVLWANSIVQSQNSFSTVAHIAGMGLKAIPTISRFSCLRSVNISGNFIVHIAPGSLPKSLHTLNLSRNKIATITGLRDLTRLRVLDLSYNRLSRIGHGLSNCTLIKDLYLASNKISDVEGLHRLFKLTVLDLSFNKITTSKALGQLVANYNSLLTLNLLGNPIQGNIGDDQLRKTVHGLLPQLAYLNKQPIKSQRGREAVMDGVARAASGNSNWDARRKSARHLAQVSSSAKGRNSNGGSCKVQHRLRSNRH